jgi:hypothetical protein
VTIKFVPAYNQCTTGNTTHGAPFSNASCNPPVASSGQLTVGSPDANGLAANSVGQATFKVVGGSQGVQVTGSFTDVRRKSNPAQTYSGQVSLQSNVRITDRFNVGDQATVTDLPFGLTSTCSAGSCNFATSFNAAMPGVIRDGERAIWQMGQVQVFDGGPDGVVSTTPNTLFATQGFFTP